MNKGDIKATITMIISISWCVFCALELEKTNTYKDGAFYVLGFILGIASIALTICTWNIIRLFFED
jgi:hypothetical protein